MNSRGDLALLERRHKIGLLCSIQCPGDVILKTLDLMQELRNTEVCVVSGFHSPMEKECLSILLRGTCGIVLCLARSLPKRIPAEHRKQMEAGRMLLLSPFSEKQRRITAGTSEVRNRAVADLADVVLVPYAAPGGRVEEICKEILTTGKPVCTFSGAHGYITAERGARVIASAEELIPV